MVLVGKDGVGKTAIAIRFLQGTFVDKYDPTVEDSYRKNVQIDNVHYVVEILDTAGLELMTAMKDLHMKDGQGFVLVFDVTDRKSFEALPGIRAEIERLTDSNDFPCIVVGNKSDLEEKRQVTPEEGNEWSSKFPDSKFMEVSAKMSTTIEEIFLQLLQQILKAEQRKAAEAAAKPEELTEVPATPVEGTDNGQGQGQGQSQGVPAGSTTPLGKKSKKDKDCTIS